MSDQYRFDPESAFKGQRALVEAVTDMQNGAERRLRGLALPEMPSAIRSSVAGTIGQVVGMLSKARVAVGAVARELHDKAGELGVHAQMAQLPWWVDAADFAASGTDPMAEILRRRIGQIEGAPEARAWANAQIDHTSGAAGEGYDIMHEWLVDSVDKAERHVPMGGFGPDPSKQLDGFLAETRELGQFAGLIARVNPVAAGADIALGRKTAGEQLSAAAIYSVAHPGDVAKALVNYDAYKKGGFSYWYGTLGPGAVTAVLTRGAGPAMKAGSAGRAARDASRAEAQSAAAVGPRIQAVNAEKRAADGAEKTSKARDAARAQAATKQSEAAVNRGERRRGRGGSHPSHFEAARWQRRSEQLHLDLIREQGLHAKTQREAKEALAQLDGASAAARTRRAEADESLRAMRREWAIWLARSGRDEVVGMAAEDKSLTDD